jgi:outer membrane receptor protein involved in Fe transport
MSLVSEAVFVRHRLIVATATAVLPMLTLPASAQTADQSLVDKASEESRVEQKKNENKSLQTVEVRGEVKNYDPRRDDTASKTVINAEEIGKYGDNNIYDVLKRAPGITVTGKTLRMRGLGVGYTQILVNGDRPPPGFSLDVLNPMQIERIEIIRTATAEFSMQAIAGTINIVLKKITAKPQRDLRLSVSRSAEQQTRNAGGTWADKKGRLSFFLNVILYDGTSEEKVLGEETFIVPSGELVQSRRLRSHGSGIARGGMLSPRLSWKFENGDQLNASAGLQSTRSTTSGTMLTDNLVGTFLSPDYIENMSSSLGSQRVLSGEIGWIAKVAGGKLDLKLSSEHSRYISDYGDEMYTIGRELRLLRDWDKITRVRRNSIKGKYTRSLFDGHSLAAGLESSVQVSEETRDRNEQLGPALPTHIFESSTPRLKRLAGFVQDEWDVNKQISLYLGVRWEGVQTDSEGTNVSLDQDGPIPSTHSRSHVLGPAIQTLYKLPGSSTRQFRLALSRTYKAPSLQQLSARRYNVPVNSRFTPDSGGNPEIRPELANGIDLSYEHFLNDDAMFSMSVAQRKISDYIVEQLDVDANGRWLYHPRNAGDALVRSFQVEAKLPGSMLNPAANGLELRASLSRNWSHVSAVSGPGNRIDAQIPVSATLGMDYRKGSLTGGASLAWQKGGYVRISEAQSQLQQTRRDLDAYVLWKFNANYQARFSLNNILGMDDLSERFYRDASGVSHSHNLTSGSMQVAFGLEIKL